MTLDNTKHIIAWEKWNDPYQPDEDDNELELTLQEKQMLNEELGADAQASIPHILKEQYKVVLTPMGVVPIQEHSIPSKVFNFWNCYTNFNISKNVKNIVKKIDGVETLDIFTRYRMRISIGKMFEDGKVMNSVNTALKRYVNGRNEDSQNKVGKE